jgi:uncharacterized membrane protein YidH (DUF202 family)
MLARMILAGPIEFTRMESLVLLMFLGAVFLSPIGMILFAIGVTRRKPREGEIDPAGEKARRRAHKMTIVGAVLLIPAVFMVVVILIENLKTLT